MGVVGQAEPTLKRPVGLELCRRCIEAVVVRNVYDLSIVTGGGLQATPDHRAQRIQRPGAFAPYLGVDTNVVVSIGVNLEPQDLADVPFAIAVACNPSAGVQIVDAARPSDIEARALAIGAAGAVDRGPAIAAGVDTLVDVSIVVAGRACADVLPDIFHRVPCTVRIRVAEVEASLDAGHIHRGQCHGRAGRFNSHGTGVGKRDG